MNKASWLLFSVLSLKAQIFQLLTQCAPSGVASGYDTVSHQVRNSYHIVYTFCMLSRSLKTSYKPQDRFSCTWNLFDRKTAYLLKPFRVLQLINKDNINRSLVLQDSISQQPSYGPCPGSLLASISQRWNSPPCNRLLHPAITPAV